MSNYSNEQLEEFSEIFKALANPNRLSIFLRLASCCEPGTACCEDGDMHQCAGDVGQDLGIAPSTVSHHLKELRRAGLIRMERQGKRVRCWTEPAIMQNLGNFFLQGDNEKA
jgi:DNA-binding transcriptional ArsR family regulator